MRTEALDRTVWRTGFVRGCEPVVRLRDYDDDDDDDNRAGCMSIPNKKMHTSSTVLIILCGGLFIIQGC